MSKLTGMQVKLIRMSIWGHVIRNDIHTGHLMFLFPLHSSILKPDFYLPFRQTEGVGDFDASSPSQVPVEVKFFFQFERLVSGIGGPLSFRLPIGIHCTWNNNKFQSNKPSEPVFSEKLIVQNH